jgi:hypothetical protein
MGPKRVVGKPESTTETLRHRVKPQTKKKFFLCASVVVTPEGGDGNL